MGKSPFDHLIGQDKADEMEAHAAADFETRLVKRLIAKAGLRITNEVRKLSKEQTGRPCMTFDAFYQLVPEFPFLFCSRFEPAQSRQTKLSDVFKHLDSLKGTDALSDMLDETAGTVWENSCGVVVPWGGVPNGLVFHNSSVSYLPQTGSRITWYHEGDIRIVVEPYQQLLKSIDWSA